MRARVPFQFNVGVLLLALAGLPAAVLIAVPTFGDDAEPRERTILMTSGRVLTGFASRNAGGWLLEQSNGRVQIPLEQVRVVADSMIDAYRHQRDSVAEPTPATHIALAQWCIAYRLHNEARDELRKCLKLDPDNSSARKLLRRIEDIMDRADAKPASMEQSPRRSVDGFLVADAESLGGLSNEAAITFTQRIQPLLMNKCGNASCHGTIRSAEKSEGFHLIAVRSGSNAHRLYTERNLAEVLRYIDMQEPTRSPLAAVPQGTHGGVAGVFHGTVGNSQIKMLRGWIGTVADEKLAEEEALSPARPSIVAKSRRLSKDSRKEEPDPLDGDVDHSLVASQSVTGKLNRRETTETGTGGRPMELTLAQRQAETDAAQNGVDDPKITKHGDDEAGDLPADDPFDPDIFNRRFHSPSRR